MEEIDIWLSARELADLKLKTLQKATRTTIVQWAKKYGWQKKPKEGKGGGFLFSFTSLSEETQKEIKNNSDVWNKVCELSKSRQNNPASQTEWGNQKGKHNSIHLNKNFFKDSIHRLIAEEIKIKGCFDRVDLSKNLGISIEEFEKYETGELFLNIFQLKRLHELGYDIWFIILGTRGLRTDKGVINNEIKQKIEGNAIVSNKISNN